MPPASRSATLVVRMASSSEVLPWSTWPITVTTGGRSLSWLGSDSSSSSTSPSIERNSTSQLNLSATSLAAVGSSTSLMTSTDLRRIAAASSPTVTDSGSLISSRLISCGGSGGAGGAGAGGAGAAGFTGVAGAAAAAGRTAAGAGAAGRGGAAGRAGGGATVRVGTAGTIDRKSTRL